MKTAIGFDATRGDDLSLINIPFENGDQVYQVKPKTGFQIQDYANKLVILAAMIGAVVVFLSIFSKVRRNGIGVSQPVAILTQPRSILQNSAAAGRIPDQSERIQAAEYSEEVLRAGKVKEDVSTYIQNKPTDAAKLLKVWLTDGE